MKTRIPLLLLCLLMMAGSTFAGGKKGKQPQDEIRKPLSEHLVGKWRWAESFGMKDGKWSEYIVPDSIYGRVMLCKDGTAQHIRTFPGEYMAMKRSEWTTDEEAVIVTISGAPSPVLRLTADEFGFSMMVGADPEKGIAGEERRWLFRRIDMEEKHPIETYPGKWVLSRTYVKRDG